MIRPARLAGPCSPTPRKEIRAILDDEFVSRFKAGDRVAHAEAYTRYGDRVYSLVRRLLRSDSTSADLTHDAFIRAFERAAEFRGEADLGSWIGRIAINFALQHLRRQRLFLAFEKRSEPRFAHPTTSVAIDIDRAIMSLPSALRVSFVLVTIEGYSLTEAARTIGIGEAACRQRVHRARVKLAAALSDYRRS